MSGPSRRALLGWGAAGGAALLGGGLAGYELLGPAAGGPFSAAFPGSGLVTNEFAFHHPGDPRAHVSEQWDVTSGSLFAAGGCGWTGVPDGEYPGPDSAAHTDSAVFRLVTRRRDFADVTVRTAVRLLPPVTTARTPAQDWDGGHVWLRYHSPQQLYALSFRRRDGTVVIKRKVPADDAAAADGGDYATLAEAGHALSYGGWHQITASAADSGGHVRLRLAIDGTTVLDTVDRTPGSLTGPGGVGLRADNSQLWFRGFTAR